MNDSGKITLLRTKALRVKITIACKVDRMVSVETLQQLWLNANDKDDGVWIDVPKVRTNDNVYLTDYSKFQKILKKTF
jgi:hypothetical protein